VDPGQMSKEYMDILQYIPFIKGEEFLFSPFFEFFLEALRK
jgi:hypothetical protein